MTGPELKDIALARINTGKILIENKDWDMAWYILGYVLECALKSVICKTLKLDQYPDLDGMGKKVTIFKTHEFAILLILSGMESEFSIKNASTRLQQNWSDLTKWDVSVRYDRVGTKTEAEAKRMYEALTETENGIITWMTNQQKW